MEKKITEEVRELSPFEKIREANVSELKSKLVNFQTSTKTIRRRLMRQRKRCRRRRLRHLHICFFVFFFINSV